MEARSRTRLVQGTVWNITSAGEAFNEQSHDRSEMAMVMVPNSVLESMCCITPFFSVPAGNYVLWQSWGKNQGVLKPGLQICWPFWNRISHVVSRAAITYNAPTVQVPTADNVMVDVDISINFTIAQDENAPSDFVYKIGAHNFNEYLSSKVEEAMRGLVYGVPHNKVNDLRESFAIDMLDSLRAKMAIFGIHMMNVKVTNVKLPVELQKRLEKTTAFQTKIEEAQKNQETKKLLLSNSSLKKLEALRKENALKLQEIFAECTRFDTEIKEMCDAEKGKGRVLETQMMSEAESRITQATGDKNVARAEGESKAEERIRSTTITAEASKVQADQDFEVKVMASKARLTAASNKAEGMIAMAQAEAGAAQKLEVKRSVELELNRLSVMQDIAGKGRRVLTGTAADTLMSELIQTKAGRNSK